MQRKKTDISFETFWGLYPLHRARKPAERAWARLSARDRAAAIAGIAQYREQCERTGTAFKYAQGWLNDRRWEDEYGEPPSPAPTPSPAPQKEGSGGSPQDMDSW